MRKLFADRDERFVVEEQAVVVDALGRNEREVEIVAVGERASNVGADQEAGGGRRRTEQRVLDHDQLERAPPWPR